MTCRSRSTPAMASFRWAVYGLSMGVTMSARRDRSALPDASRAIPGPSNGSQESQGKGTKLVQEGSSTLSVNSVPGAVLGMVSLPLCALVLAACGGVAQGFQLPWNVTSVHRVRPGDVGPSDRSEPVRLDPLRLSPLVRQGRCHLQWNSCYCCSRLWNNHVGRLFIIVCLSVFVSIMCAACDDEHP